MRDINILIDLKFHLYSKLTDLIGFNDNNLIISRINKIISKYELKQEEIRFLYDGFIVNKEPSNSANLVSSKKAAELLNRKIVLKNQ